MVDMRKRRWSLLGITAAAAIALSGCAAGDGSSDSGSGDGEGGSGDTLIVYTNSNSDGRGEWITEKAAEAGIDIEIVGLGGADLTNRIIAEKNNPVGDVVFGLNNMFFEQLKAEDAITAYEPSWSGEVPADAGDPADGAFWPLVEQAIVTVYDENRITDAPTDEEDLWTEDYAGRYEVNPALGQATPQLVLASILTRYLDEDGDLGVSDEGWEKVEAYYANGSPAVEGTDLYARISREEVDYGVLPSSGIAARDEEYGTTTGMIVPEYGVPYVTEQIAQINGTGNEEKAQEFIDWFGSAEVQGEFAAEFNSMPVNEGAIEQANPEVVELLEGLPRQDIDFGFVSENLGAWVEKVTLEYIG
ncbi:extracellular solute-binding protein [Microbacterium sp. 179-I 3D4 NHS]|uniref:extracellular solute-binding protein n=1 Tax=Microbacterium sp. 179-I 3D4 NHS TaxID=3142381 RepID=UPI0039A37D5E